VHIYVEDDENYMIVAVLEGARTRHATLSQDNRSSSLQFLDQGRVISRHPILCGYTSKRGHHVLRLDLVLDDHGNAMQWTDELARFFQLHIEGGRFFQRGWRGAEDGVEMRSGGRVVERLDSGEVGGRQVGAGVGSCLEGGMGGGDGEFFDGDLGCHFARTEGWWIRRELRRKVGKEERRKKGLGLRSFGL